MDTNQCPTNLGLSFGGLNCLVVFPTHFNPSTSLLILLQISLLFMCTPALSMTWLEGCLRNMIAKLMPIRGDSRVKHKRQQQKTVTTQPLVTNKLNGTCIAEGTTRLMTCNTIRTLQFTGLADVSYVVFLPPLRRKAVRESKLSQSWSRSSIILSRRNIRFLK